MSLETAASSDSRRHLVCRGLRIFPSVNLVQQTHPVMGVHLRYGRRSHCAFNGRRCEMLESRSQRAIFRRRG